VRLQNGTPQDLINNLPAATARNQNDRAKRGGWQSHKRGIRKVATQKRKRPRNTIPAGEDILQDDPTLTMNDAELEAQADLMMDALGM
jgi:hypothetical protein